MENGVYLIGAGPGDAGLITQKGVEILKKCDVVVYDNLANPLLLGHTKSTCLKIYVGKKAGQHTLSQDQINELLVEQAQIHPVVVRLKGGDPYVFGRGSEEAGFLGEHNIHFEVVPGITSAIGGLTYAGIPITARNVATSFHVITGHLDESSEPVNYEALAKIKGTLVFLMGVKNLGHITSSLLRAGKSPTTPAALVYQATTHEQQTYLGTLATIEAVAKANAVKAPSLIVIGAVVNFSEQLDFFTKQKLRPKSVLVCSAPSKQDRFEKLLQDNGYHPVMLPVVSLIPSDNNALATELANIGDYHGLIFTSSFGVEVFFDQLFHQNCDSRALAGLKIYAIGKQTATALKKLGIIADGQPESYSNEALVAYFKARPELKGRYLLPRSSQGDQHTGTRLQEILDLTIVSSYAPAINDKMEMDPNLLKSIDYFAFTSSSMVEAFINLCQQAQIEIKEIMNQAQTFAIGPATATTLEQSGISEVIKADEHTYEGLLALMNKTRIKGDKNETNANQAPE